MARTLILNKEKFINIPEVISSGESNWVWDSKVNRFSNWLENTIMNYEDRFNTLVHRVILGGKTGVFEYNNLGVLYSKIRNSSKVEISKDKDNTLFLKIDGKLYNIFLLTKNNYSKLEKNSDLSKFKPIKYKLNKM